MLTVGGEVMYGIQPGPVVTLSRPKSWFVVEPRGVEIDLSIYTSLDHRGTGIKSMLTVHLSV